MTVVSTKKNMENVAKYADMLSAMGTEPRLRIMQLLLSMHPDGLVAFFAGLAKEGISQADIDLMSKTNPARALGLDAPDR